MRPTALIEAILLAIATVAAPALAQSVQVTDGDTLKLNDTTYRLWGIDAPESKQACADDWPAGQEATKALSDLIQGRAVACEARTQDRYGRTVGLCRADGQDIGAAMVRAGMAWAFVRYSFDYVAQEAEAKAANSGVHAHGCQPAWEWRAERR